MSQRLSGYACKANDHYATPRWVTQAVIPHLGLPIGLIVLEPAPGDGAMAVVLENAGYRVIRGAGDYLEENAWLDVDAIVTNPPYGPGGRLAQRFIENALEETRPNGVVAIVLKVDFDSGKTGAHLFDDSSFAKRLILRDRIVWFEPATPQRIIAGLFGTIAIEGQQRSPTRHSPISNFAPDAVVTPPGEVHERASKFANVVRRRLAQTPKSLIDGKVET
jgi:hypothetical protein